jgi:hypothetical protein
MGKIKNIYFLFYLKKWINVDFEIIIKKSYLLKIIKF